MRAHRVHHLLMGGQACVSYGAAEFSRDVDLALLADADNLVSLRSALTDLSAEPVAVPSLELAVLQRGHAVHYRCLAADGIRLDLMSAMRGVAPFPELWQRRTTIEVDAEPIELLGLPDLVQAKKTQRDKDWPMIRRLVEVNYFSSRESATPARVEFWLRELRTTTLLVEVAGRFPEETARVAATRAAARAAIGGDAAAIDQALAEEQQREREADRRYWAPLRAELEALRHGRSP